LSLRLLGGKYLPLISSFFSAFSVHFDVAWRIVIALAALYPTHCMSFVPALINKKRKNLGVKLATQRY
jgi:hypothetical protein